MVNFKVGNEMPVKIRNEQDVTSMGQRKKSENPLSYENSWRLRATARYSEGHGLDSCRGLSFFSLCHARVILIITVFSCHFDFYEMLLWFKIKGGRKQENLSKWITTHGYTLD